MWSPVPCLSCPPGFTGYAPEDVPPYDHQVGTPPLKCIMPEPHAHPGTEGCTDAACLAHYGHASSDAWLGGSSCVDTSSDSCNCDHQKEAATVAAAGPAGHFAPAGSTAVTESAASVGGDPHPAGTAQESSEPYWPGNLWQSKFTAEWGWTASSSKSGSPLHHHVFPSLQDPSDVCRSVAGSLPVAASVSGRRGEDDLASPSSGAVSEEEEEAHQDIECPPPSTCRSDGNGALASHVPASVGGLNVQRRCLRSPPVACRVEDSGARPSRITAMVGWQGAQRLGASPTDIQLDLAGLRSGFSFPVAARMGERRANRRANRDWAGPTPIASMAVHDGGSRFPAARVAGLGAGDVLACRSLVTMGSWGRSSPGAGFGPFCPFKHGSCSSMGLRAVQEGHCKKAPQAGVKTHVWALHDSNSNVTDGSRYNMRPAGPPVQARLSSLC